LSAGLDPSIGVFITAFGGVGGALGTFYLGHRIGSDRTKKECERQIEQERQRYERLLEQKSGDERVKIHFRTRIQWIEERKSDLNAKIALRETSEQEREIYRSLITELDGQKRELERSRNSIVG
jgi:hypothetical protein